MPALRSPSITLAPARGPLLHERFPSLRERLPHLPLGERPTPVRPLDGLSAEGAAPVWVKDDGAFGCGAWGGNKVRKLEWLLPEAQRRGPDDPHLRRPRHQLGPRHRAVRRGARLRTALALVDQPVDEHVARQLERLRASGAGSTSRTPRRGRSRAAVADARHSGRRPPCILPAGGSTPLGVLGYVEAGLEIAGQVEAGELPEPSHVVVAIGSAGSAAGLALGLRLAGLRTRVVGVPVTRDLHSDPQSARAPGRAAAAPAGRRVPASAPHARRPDRARRLDRPRLRPPHPEG